MTYRTFYPEGMHGICSRNLVSYNSLTSINVPLWHTINKLEYFQLNSSSIRSAGTYFDARITNIKMNPYVNPDIERMREV